MLPLVLLALWIIAGGAYARWSDGITSGFAVVGVYMLFGVLAARVVIASPARGAIFRAYLIAAALCAVPMVRRMFLEFQYGPDRSFHEMEAFVIPLAVYFALRPSGGPLLRGCLTAFFLLSTISFWKNTAFIVLGLTLLYLWLVEWRFRFRESTAFRQWVMAAALLTAAFGMAFMAVPMTREHIFPSGNVEYRSRTYEAAWDRFVEWPGWGSSFTGSAVSKFTQSRHLPSHSDVLDLAAQGGSIALALWIWAYVRGGRLVLRHAFGGRARDGGARDGRARDELTAVAHTFACMSLCGITVYAFNPILLQPSKAMLLWTHAGFLLGIALYRQAQQRPP
jgi:hypothetical protein